MFAGLWRAIGAFFADVPGEPKPCADCGWVGDYECGSPHRFVARNC